MTFASPALLYALVAASLPLLLHLVRRRRIRIIKWAAWQFLAISQQKLRRRLRIEQLILAGIRAAIIALIVLAFARPVIRTSTTGRTGEGPIHAVIALDNSAGMGYVHDGLSDFARAKQVADTLISRTLKQGDTVSVLLMSSSPKPLIKHPSHDLETARRLIKAAPISGHATRYDVAARSCMELCEASRSQRKEVFLITDSQRTGFGKAPDPAASDAWRRLAGAARITWVNVAREDRPNASVNPPVLSREFVTPGVPVRIEAGIANRTGADIPSTVVRLEVEGRAAGATALRLRSGATARASFTHTFGVSGTRTGRIVLDRPDGLAADNAAWFAVHVRKAMRVLIVGLPSSDSAASDTLYVATALAPAGASEGAASNIVTTTATRIGGAGAPLASFDVVVLAGPTPPNPQQAADLRRYIAAGGGVLAFPSAVGPSGLSALWLDVPNADVLVRPGPRRTHALAQAASLDPATVNHPSLEIFRQSDETELGAAKLTVTYDISVASSGAGGARGAAPRVALRFTDGRPAIVAGSLGEGRLILCGFPAGIGGGDLPLKAAYVPLIHQLVAHLAASDVSRRTVTVGAACALRFGLDAGPRTFRVTHELGGPVAGRSGLGSGSGGAGQAVSALRGIAGPDSVLLRCPPTDFQGLYAVEATGAGPLLADAYAANLDASEMDLSQARPDVIGAHTASVRITYARAGDNVETVVRSARYGAEFWAPLIMGALALIAVETALARAFGRRS
ncbi:MAG: VWA domain-containing protein [Armatimonadetes bacterium]|nr:VWA domain-containing protein [Armatimonadota bacterium]